jgi:hypothetical protein
MAEIRYILDLAINNDWKLSPVTKVIPPPGQTAIQAMLFVKNLASDADTAALITKDIDPSYEAGQGHIVDDGSSGSVDMYFEVSQADNKGLKIGYSYSYEVRVYWADHRWTTPEKGVLIPQ